MMPAYRSRMDESKSDQVELIIDIVRSCRSRLNSVAERLAAETLRTAAPNLQRRELRSKRSASVDANCAAIGQAPNLGAIRSGTNLVERDQNR